MSDSCTILPEDILLAEKRQSPLLIRKPTLDFVEKETIKAALQNNLGNISHTAKELSITRQTLYAKIYKYGL